jgi:CRISPR-associated protein Csa3
MKTYISLSGFDTSQIVSLKMKYGIEGGDRIILIRPEDEKDTHGEQTVQAIRDLSRQIDSSINLDIHRVNHRDFEGMVVSLKVCLRMLKVRSLPTSQEGRENSSSPLR